jgi:hypothetical protein
MGGRRSSSYVCSAGGWSTGRARSAPVLIGLGAVTVSADLRIAYPVIVVVIRYLWAFLVAMLRRVAQNAPLSLAVSVVSAGPGDRDWWLRGAVRVRAARVSWLIASIAQ